MSELIALRKETFEFVKKESLYIGILFLIAVTIFKIAFYKENFIVLLKTVISLFWLFVLPGYFIMLYWKEKLDFVERAVIGIGIAAAITGIFSYYISLIGFNLKYHAIALPLLMILIGILVNSRKSMD